MLNEYYCKYNSEDENCSRKVKKKPPVYPFPLSGKLQKKYHIIHLTVCVYIYIYILLGNLKQVETVQPSLDLTFLCALINQIQF